MLKKGEEKGKEGKNQSIKKTRQTITKNVFMHRFSPGKPCTYWFSVKKPVDEDIFSKTQNLEGNFSRKKPCTGNTAPLPFPTLGVGLWIAPALKLTMCLSFSQSLSPSPSPSPSPSLPLPLPPSLPLSLSLSLSLSRCSYPVVFCKNFPPYTVSKKNLTSDRKSKVPWKAAIAKLPKDVIGMQMHTIALCCVRHKLAGGWATLAQGWARLARRPNNQLGTKEVF